MGWWVGFGDNGLRVVIVMIKEIDGREEVVKLGMRAAFLGELLGREKEKRGEREK